MVIFLSIVIIVSTVLPVVKWIERKGYDTRLIAALVLSLFYFLLPFHSTFFKAYLDYLSVIFPTKTENMVNYVAIILSTYSIFVTYAIISYGMIYLILYLYWVAYKKMPINKLERKQLVNKMKKKTRKKKRRYKR